MEIILQCIIGMFYVVCTCSGESVSGEPRSNDGKNALLKVLSTCSRLEDQVDCQSCEHVEDFQ